MKRLLFSIMICMLTVASATAVDMNARAERKAIDQGNTLYKEKNYTGALSNYEKALKVNPASLVAQFNKALALTRIADAMPPQQEQEKSKMLTEASKMFEAVAKHTSDNPDLAARASYNHGNIAFSQEQYPDAIEDYKSALRLNPNDDKARRNLRIAQQRLPKQNKNKNKDQNKKQNQNQDQKKNKDQDQNKDKNKDKDQNKNQQNKQDKQQQSSQDMSKQAADRILKRSNDKESQTRKKLMNTSPASRGKGW